MHFPGVTNPAGVRRESALTAPRVVPTVATRGVSHPLSAAVIEDAPRYLAVIDHVLAMDYLTPDLRRRVVRMQRQLVLAKSKAHR